MSFDLHDRLDYVNSCFASGVDDSIIDTLGELKELLQFGITEPDEIKAANEAIFFIDTDMFFAWLNSSANRADDAIRLTLLTILKMWVEKIDATLVTTFSKTAFDNLFLFVKQANTSAKIVVIACKCLESILNVCNEGLESVKCDQLFTDVFTRIRSGKEKSLMVQESLLELIGTIAANQPHVVEPQRKKFEEIMVTGIKNQVEGKRKFEQSVAAGYIAALNGFYMQFAPSPLYEPKIFNIISIVLQTNSFAEMSRYGLQTNALQFFKLHLDKFTKLTLQVYPDIYAKIDFYLQQANTQLAHFAHEAMVSFQETIVCALPSLVRQNDENSSNTKGKDLFIFMYEKLFATFLKPDSKPKQLALAIEGLGRLSPFCEKFLGIEKVCQLFSQLVEKCRQIRLGAFHATRLLTQNHQTDNWQRLQYYPNLINALAAIILSNDNENLFSLASVHTNSILTFCSFMISRFPYQLPPQQKLSSKAILSILGGFYLREIDVEKAVSQFWMQCLLRACQHSSVNALIQIGASESKPSEKILSYKDYVPLLEHFLLSKSYFTLKDEQFEDEVLEKCWRKFRLDFVETIMKLIEILNLDAKKRDRSGDAMLEDDDLNSNLLVEKPSDVEIFVNISDIWTSLASNDEAFVSINSNEISYFLLCVEKLIDLAREHTHLSGWFKLLSSFLCLISKSSANIDAKVDDFEHVDSRLQNCLLPFLGYLQQEIGNFSNEMLMSALSFVLTLPVQVVSQCDVGLQKVEKLVTTAFGLKYLPLAKVALEFLQQLVSDSYNDESKKQKVLEVSKAVAPSLYPYLCVKTSDYLNDKSQIAAVRKKQARSKITHLIKRDLSEIDPEEMRSFQEKVIIFLSHIPLPIDQILISDEKLLSKNLISINGLDDPKIIYAVPFRDSKPKIKFDSLLQPIINLAETSPDRKSKVAACELLHALVVLTLGKNAQIRSAQNLHSFVSIYELIFPAMIRLAADSDSIANQLFEPLCLQCIHWFTSANSQDSPETACLISAIFDQLAADHNASIRNVSAKCLKEVFDWSIKHCPKDDDLLVKTRLKHVCKMITFNAKNPSLKLKTAAICAFSACKRSFREYRILVDAFAIEWLFAFLELLKSAAHAGVNERLASDVIEPIRSLSRIICKYGKLFQTKSNSRRVPFGLQDANLHEIVTMLAEKLGSPEIEYRRIIFELIGDFLKVMSETPATFFKSLNKVSGCVNRFELEITMIVDFESNEPGQIVEFLYNLLAKVDCYSWALESVKLDAQTLLKSSETKLWVSISKFLQFATAVKINDVRTQLAQESYSKSESFDRLISNLTIALMSLVCSVNRRSRSKEVAKLFSSVLSEEFCTLICVAIFSPSDLGLNCLSKEDMKSFASLLTETSKILQTLSSHRVFLETKVMERLFENSQLKSDSFCLTNLLKSSSAVSQKELHACVNACRVSLETFASMFSTKLREEISSSLQFFLMTSKEASYSIIRTDLVEKVLEFSWDLHFDPVSFVKQLSHNLTTVSSKSSSNSFSNSLLAKCDRKLKEKFVREIKSCSAFLLDSWKTFNLVAAAVDLWFVNRAKWRITKTDRNDIISSFVELLNQLIAKYGQVTDSKIDEALLEIHVNLIALDTDKVLNQLQFSGKIAELFCAFISKNDASLALKSQCLDLIPFLLNLDHDSTVEKVCQALRAFITDDLSTRETAANGSTANFMLKDGAENYSQLSFQKLFFGLRVTSSQQLLKLLIAPVCRDETFPHIEDFSDALNAAIMTAKFNLARVAKIFNETLEMALGNYSLMPDVRRRVFERVLKPFMNGVSPNVFKQVFLEKVGNLMSAIEYFESFNPLNRPSETTLLDKILDLEIVFSILDSAVQIFPAAEFIKLDSELNRKFHQVSKRDSKLSLMKFLLQTSANCKNHLLVPSNITANINASEIRNLSCVAYQCLTSVIMNCVNKSEFFVSFLLDEKPKNQKLWLSVLIEDGAMFQFAAEVASPQSVKSRRLELRSRRSQRNQLLAFSGDHLTQAGSTQRNYLSSNHIIDSSVRDELAQFDFNNATVKLSDANLDANGDTEELMDLDNHISKEELPKEYLVPDVVDDPVTTLPIFVTTVHIVKHLSSLQQDSEASTSMISTAMLAPGGQQLPNWVVKFKSQFQTAKHLNILIFMAKVVITCEDNFSLYAEKFLPEMIRVLEMYLVQSKLITSFVVELTCLIADWNQQIVVNKPEFELGTVEKSALNRILTSIFQHCPHSNSALFKNNVELLKILLENFKRYFELDFDVIYEKLRVRTTEKSPELDAGIQILGLIAAHKLPTFPDISIIERCAMFQSLIKHLSHQSITVYAPVAETVGLILSYYHKLDDAAGKMFYEELNKLTVQVLTEIKQTSSRFNALGKFFSIFSYICDRFHEFGAEIVDQAFFSLQSLTGKLKVHCLNVIYHHCNDHPNAFISLKSHGILSNMLSNLDQAVQLASLRILEKMVQIITDRQCAEVFDAICKRLPDQLSSAQSRLKMYEILMELHKKSKDSDLNFSKSVLSVLIRGVADADKSISIEVLTYISKLESLPETVSERILTFFKTFYSHDYSSTFTKDCINLIFDVCSRSPDYNLEMFENPLDKCLFQNVPIQNAWLNHRSGLLPMFIDTQPLEKVTETMSSQVISQSLTTESATAVSSSTKVNVRATVQNQNLQFTATNINQEVSQSFSWLAESRGTKLTQNLGYQGSYDSTLLADARTESRALESTKGKRRVLVRTENGFKDVVMSDLQEQQARKTSSRDRVRLHVLAKRDSNQEKSYYVKKAYDSAKETQRTAVESSVRKANEVVIYRSYRAGDIPDIQIKNSDLIVPLLGLAQNEPSICSLLFVELCQGVIANMIETDSADDDFWENLSQAFNSVLNESKSQSRNYLLVQAIVAISAKWPSMIKLDLTCLVKCSIDSRQELLTIAYLEQKLLDSLDQTVTGNANTTSKRRKVDQQEAANEVNLPLAKLFRSTGDCDHLEGFEVGLFADVTKNLIKLENSKQFKQAISESTSTIEECPNEQDYSNDVDLWTDILTNSVSSLCDWSQLSSLFASEIKLENENSRFMPHFENYVDAKCKLLLDDADVSDDFCTYLEKITNEANSRKQFSRRFPLNMSLVLLKQGYPFNAKDILRTYALPELQFSIHNLTLPRGIAMSLSSEKCPKFHPASQLLKFLSSDLENRTSEKSAESINNISKFDLDANEVSVSTWEEVRIVRKICFEFLSELNGNIDSSLEKLSSTKMTEFSLGMAQASVKQSQLELTNRLLHEIKSESVLNKNPKHSFSCELTNVDYLVKVAAIHDKPSMVANHFKKSIDKLLSFLSCDLLNSHKNFKALMSSLARCVLNLYNLSASDSNLVCQINPVSNLCLPDDFQIPWSDDECPSDALDACFKTLRTCCEYPLQKDEQTSAESFYDLAKFCVNYLDSLGDSSEPDQNFSDQILYTLLTSSCEAMRNGKVEASALFPRLVAILSNRIPEAIQRDFGEQISQVPSWMFLAWVEQIMSYLNEDHARSILKPLIVIIAKDYPQAMYFPFKTTLEGNENFAKEQKFVNEIGNLVKNDVLERVLDELQNAALTPIVLLSDLMKDLSRMVPEKRVEAYSKMCEELFGAGDISRIGPSLYQKQLETNLKPALEKIWGQKGSKLKSKDMSIIRTEFVKLKSSCAEHLKLPNQLSEYSSYLANFSEINPYCDVEIPGQYECSKRPDVNAHVKISGFRNDIRVMESIRKPRRICILGSDEKEYSFLLKGGEDLRQDARLMKVFKLMNTILKTNPESNKRNLWIQTYDVTPMTLKLGLIQWVPNTTTYQLFFEKICGDAKIDQAKRAMHQKVTAFMPGKDVTKFFYLWTKGAKQSESQQVIETCAGILNKFSFRKAIEKLAISPDAFIVLRDRFVRSYSCMSIAHYILGIGDRHTSNTLIDLQTCTAVGIDFGHAFGTATQFLPVPELVPFRFTPMISNLTVPQVAPTGGVAHAAMLKTLEALRENQESLMNILQIFLREPVLDWVEFATRQVNAMRRSGNLDGELEETKMVWYPKQKLKGVEQKLNGWNPLHLIKSEELDLNSFVMKDSAALLRILLGDKMDVRWALQNEQKLTAHQQVTCLLDQATDPKLLGRAWLGWSPFA